VVQFKFEVKALFMSSNLEWNYKTVTFLFQIDNLNLGLGN